MFAVQLSPPDIVLETVLSHAELLSQTETLSELPSDPKYRARNAASAGTVISLS